MKSDIKMRINMTKLLMCLFDEKRKKKDCEANTTRNSLNYTLFMFKMAKERERKFWT